MRVQFRTRSGKLSVIFRSVEHGDLTDQLICRKIETGMVAYEKNTGSPHPLSGGINLKTSSKRSTGSDPLIDDNSDLWYGTISIGTPPVRFAGMTLSFC